MLLLCFKIVGGEKNMQWGNRVKDKDIAAGKEAKWAAKITGKIYKNVLKLLLLLKAEWCDSPLDFKQRLVMDCI